TEDKKSRGRWLGDTNVMRSRCGCGGRCRRLHRPGASVADPVRFWRGARRCHDSSGPPGYLPGGRPPCWARMADPARALRIVSLNLWGGQALDALLEFIRQQAPTTDLFCFQEMLDGPELIPLACGFRTTLYHELTDLLPDFAGAFDPVVA